MAWKHLRHPNILPLLGATLRDHKLCLISEWMDQGNINDYLNRKEHSEVNRIELLVDVVDGLSYMHGLQVVHGNLKGVSTFTIPRHYFDPPPKPQGEPIRQKLPRMYRRFLRLHNRQSRTWRRHTRGLDPLPCIFHCRWEHSLDESRTSGSSKVQCFKPATDEGV